MKSSRMIDNLSIFSKERMLRCVLSMIFIVSSAMPGNVQAQTIMAAAPAAPQTAPLSRLFGLQIHPDDPLRIDFYVDGAKDEQSLENHDEELLKLIRYFLAALAIPDDQMWVNLSPAEPDRIIPSALGKTELGYGMLAQDFVLKTMTASLLSPDGEQGRIFWEKFYRACEESGQSPEGMKDLLHRVWIVPGSADVAVRGMSVFVVGSRLKVLMDDERSGTPLTQSQAVKGLLKDHLIPLLEKEVNEGEAFLPLRRMYDAVILAVWYKTRLSRGPLHEMFVDQDKVKGQGDVRDDQWRAVYDQYVKAFHDGVYNTIKEEYDPGAQHTIVREYVTGGLDLASLNTTIHDDAVDAAVFNRFLDDLHDPKTVPSFVQAVENDLPGDFAMMAARPVHSYPQERLEMIRNPDGTAPKVNSLTVEEPLMWPEKDQDGRLVYRGGISKLRSMIQELAASGVRRVYFYGGLYKMSNSSVHLHREPNQGDPFFQPDEDTLIMGRYPTKSKQLSGLPGGQTIVDEYGNPFSPEIDPKTGKILLNPYLSDHPETVTQEELEQELRAAIDEAKVLGVDVMLDLVPWLSPDAINENNYRWTHWRRLTDIESKDVASRKIDALKDILRKNDGFFAKRIKDQWILIRHHNNGENKDQVYLDARKPEVQEYYINILKRLIDLHSSDTRIDLPHFLFRSELKKEFGDEQEVNSVETEPLYKILKAAKDYAGQNKKLFFLMESYDEGQWGYLKMIAARAEVDLQVYDSAPRDRYTDMVRENHSAQKFSDALENVLVPHMKNNIAFVQSEQELEILNEQEEKYMFPRVAAPTDYDNPSLSDLGGPTEAATQMFLLLAHFGVPVKMGHDTWTRASGNPFTIPGGIYEGVISHSWANQKEFETTMRPGAMVNILKMSPFSRFVKTLQALDKGKPVRPIFQKHEDYPWYFMDYANPDFRYGFITMGWRFEGELHLMIMRRSAQGEEETVPVALPPDLAAAFGRDHLDIRMPAGRQSLLLRVRKNDANELTITEPFVWDDEMFASADMSEVLAYFDQHPDELSEVLGLVREGQIHLKDDLKTVLQSFQKMKFTEEHAKQMKEGTLPNIYEKLGAHAIEFHGKPVGTYFAVSAPDAREAAVEIEELDGTTSRHALTYDAKSGTWHAFVPRVSKGLTYQFRILPRNGRDFIQNDPYAFSVHLSPDGKKIIPVIADLNHAWSDQEWEKQRAQKQALDAPILISQIHLGSWMQKQDEEGGPYRKMTYREIAEPLIKHMKEMSYTHVQIMPPMEHRNYASAGYATDAFYAPSSRYGSPEDFKFLIDQLHQAGIGVFLEWSPVYVPDELKASLKTKTSSKDGKTIYDFADSGVREFFIGSALYWMKEYHVDGLYIHGVEDIVETTADAQNRPPSDEGVGFLQYLNQRIKTGFPGRLIFREGLGANDFNDLQEGYADHVMKWNSGWTGKNLNYFRNPQDNLPVVKHFLTKVKEYFRDRFSNKFIYPLPWTFLRNGRGILEQMAGKTLPEKMNNMKMQAAYNMTAPGKHLTFMGFEFGLEKWDVNYSIDWHLVKDPDSQHSKLKKFQADLNRICVENSAFHDLDFDANGIEWIYKGDQDGVMVFARRSLHNPGETEIVVFNFSNKDFGGKSADKLEFGVPWGGDWNEIINSDDVKYGGSGRVNSDPIKAANGKNKQIHGKTNSLSVRLAPNSMAIFKGVNSKDTRQPQETFHTTQIDLARAAEEMYRPLISGTIEPPEKTVFREGEDRDQEIVIRIVADGPAPRKGKKPEAFIHWNNNATGEWVNQKAKFVRNINGRAVYEVRCKPERSFKYTAYFMKDGHEKWIDLPDGKDYEITVQEAFKGWVWQIGSEFKPIIAKGGQADVNFELSAILEEYRKQHLEKHGNGVGLSMILPYYKDMPEKYSQYDFQDTGISFEVPLNHRNVVVRVRKAEVEGVMVYVLDAEAEDIFTKPYDGDRKQFLDSIVLSRGSLEFLTKMQAQGQKVDIIQTADHHTALIPLYMRTVYQEAFKHTGSLLMIHSMIHKGIYTRDWIEDINIPNLRRDQVIFKSENGNDDINLMGAGLKAMSELGHGRDAVGTVSDTYLKEIMDTEFGGQKLLHNIRHKFGIVNGQSPVEWNPATTEEGKKVAVPYDINDGIDSVIEAKKANKQYLQELLSSDENREEARRVIGLKPDDTIYGYLKPDDSRMMLLAFSRIDPQKQYDIAGDVILDMIEGRRDTVPMDVIIGGPSDHGPSIKQFKTLVEKAQASGLDIRVVFIHGYVKPRPLIAAADFLLMPSNEEPCGLVQLQALRYGAIVIARQTGGLNDTVFEFGPARNGFLFKGSKRPPEYDSTEDNRIRRQNADEFAAALGRAIDMYQNHPEEKKIVQANGMRMDTSWDNAKWKYMDAYRILHLEATRGGGKAYAASFAAAMLVTQKVRAAESIPQDSFAPGGVDFASKYLKMNEIPAIQVDWAELEPNVAVDLPEAEGLVGVIGHITPFDRSAFRR